MRTLFLVSFLVTYSSTISHGFFWSTPPAVEPQPQQKSMPMGYFRTFSLHPLAPSSALSYRFIPSGVSAPMIPKEAPIGTFVPQQSYAQLKEPTGQGSPINTPVQPPMNTNAPITHQQTAPAPDMSGYQTAIHSSLPVLPHQGQTQQQLPQYPNYPNQRKFPAYPENPFQYVPPQPQYNLQQVQFVPCMCPVSINFPGLTPEPRTPLIKIEDESPLTTTVETQPQQIIETSAGESGN